METVESLSPVAARSRSSLSSPSDNMAKRAARNSRVHFDEDGEGLVPEMEQEHPIIVQVVGEEKGKVLSVYLGFLQEAHKYDVRFGIPLEMCEGYLLPPPPPSSSVGNADGAGSGEVSDSSATPRSSEQDHPYLCPRVISKGEFCEVSKMEWTYRATKARTPQFLVQMDVTIPSANSVRVFEDSLSIGGDVLPARFVRFNISAKVMGKTMGTPTLKDGIKCTGLCPDLHGSDSSDSDEKDGETKQDVGDIN